MNEQLIIDIQNRIRDAESLDALFNEIDTEIYDEEDFHRL